MVIYTVVFISNHIHKPMVYNGNAARGMEFGSLDGGDNRENCDVGLVKISKLFATQGSFFLWGSIS